MVARGRGRKAAAATEAEAVISNGNAFQENEVASEVVAAPAKKGRARGVKKGVKEEVDELPPVEIAVEKQVKPTKAPAKGSKKAPKGKAAALAVEEEEEAPVEVKQEEIEPENGFVEAKTAVPEKKASGRKRKVDNSEKVEEADTVVKKVPKVTKTKGAKKETVDSDGIPEDPAAAGVSITVLPAAETNGTKKSSSRKRGAPKPETVAAETVSEKQNHIEEPEEEVAPAPAKKAAKSRTTKKEPKEPKEAKETKKSAPKTKASKKAHKPAVAEQTEKNEEEEATEHDVLPEEEFVPEVEEEEQPQPVEVPKPKKVVKSKGSRKQVTPAIEEEKPAESAVVEEVAEEPTPSEPQESEAESASATASAIDEEPPTKSRGKKPAAAKKEKAPAKAAKPASSKRGVAKGKKASKDELPQEPVPAANNNADNDNDTDKAEPNEDKPDAAADVETSKTKMNGTAKPAAESAQPKIARGRKRAAPTATVALTDETEETEKKPGRGRKRVAVDTAEDDETDGSKVTKSADGGLFNPTKTDYNSKDFAMDKEFNLKISSWNIAGLRAWLKKDGLTYMEHEQPDILCLQEIKCTPDQLPEEARIPGYHPYWLCMPGGHAGVAVYSKIMPINVEYGIGNPEHDDSGRLITAEYEKFYLLCVYVPNSGRKLVNLDKRMQWEELFREYVQKLEKVKPVIIAGDMNCSHKEIDLANPKTNTRSAGFTIEERDAMSKLLGLGYVDTFRHFHPDQKGAYTYWTYLGKARSRNVGWRLDYFILSERIVSKAVESLMRPQVLGSDHCPITLFLNI